MRPPWSGESQETAELEALQTDIMRFVAILGLCLAAIFSLVHSAAVEQTAAPRPEAGVRAGPVATQSAPAGNKPPSPVSPAHEPESKPEPEPRPKPEPVPEPVPDPLPESTTSLAPSTPSQAAEQTGFTLEFASVEALQFLLNSGRVQLFAKLGGGFWKLGADGVFARASAPASYYDMHPDTVPRRLRDALPRPENNAMVSWGVILPERTVGEIQQLTTSHEGGSLVIGRGGSVIMEDS